VKAEVLIEGFTPAEIQAIPDAQLDSLVFTDTPVVFRAGTAEVLAQFVIRNARLIAELAHIDGGGEGVLPTITTLLRALARRRQLAEIEWLVYATNCARPNPKLRRVLMMSGFEVERHEAKGDCYRLVERVT